MISHRAITNILKNKIQGEVSHDGITYVIEFLESICEYIADESIKELDNENKLRRFHSQYKLKRIPSSVYKRILAELYKKIFRLKDGDVGNAPKRVTTTLSIEADERWYHA